MGAYIRGWLMSEVACPARPTLLKMKEYALSRWAHLHILPLTKAACFTVALVRLVCPAHTGRHHNARHILSTIILPGEAACTIFAVSGRPSCSAVLSTAGGLIDSTGRRVYPSVAEGKNFYFPCRRLDFRRGTLHSTCPYHDSKCPTLLYMLTS